MNTVSPMLQGMIDQQAAGNLTAPSKTPAVQYAPSPITPEIKQDSVEVTTSTGKAKKAKKPMSKSLLKGGLIGGALGFAGGAGLGRFEQKALENLYREGKSLEVAEIFADLIDKNTFGKKLTQQANDFFAENMGNKCRDVFTNIIKSSKEEADDFVLFMADFIGKNKYVLGGIVAAGVAIIGLGIAAVANKVGNKSKE